MASEAISEHLISKNFLELGAWPQIPFVLHACMLIHVYIHIRHPRNPPSKNPGYGSVQHATYRWAFVFRSGTAMAHTASATTTQDLQGTAIALPTATKNIYI